MAHTTLYGFLLLCVVSRATSEGQMYRIDRYGESVTMECSPRDDVAFQYWIFPDLTLAKAGFQGSDIELLSNQSLWIPYVQKKHLGKYLCHVIDTTANQALYYDSTMYLYTPTQWEFYQMNVIIGLSAAAIFLVLSTTLCCIYYWRWEAKSDRKLKAELQHDQQTTQNQDQSHGHVHVKQHLPSNGAEMQYENARMSTSPDTYPIKIVDDTTQL